MAEENQEIQEECKQEKCVCPPGAPLWMITYSDMVTLLLTFFVLLLSMASMDPVRFTEASSSLRDAFGMHQLPLQKEFVIPTIPSPPISKITPIPQEMTQKIYQKIKTQIDAANVSKDIEVIQKDANTIILRINENILFGPGQFKVSPKSYPLLRRVGDMIRPLPMRLRIEGHTDNRVTNNSALNNWDLSVARSVSVLRFFKNGKLMPLDRMAAVGYGADRPVASNKTEEGRALNRRVDFLLKTTNSSSLGITGPQQNNVPL